MSVQLAAGRWRLHRLDPPQRQGACGHGQAAAARSHVAAGDRAGMCDNATTSNVWRY